MKTNITFKGRMGLLLNIVWTSFTIYLLAFSKEYDELIIYITKRVVETANTGGNTLIWSLIPLFLTAGMVIWWIIFVYATSAVCFKQSKEELEIKEATKRIEDKYKLIRLEKRIKKLKEKK